MLHKNDLLCDKLDMCEVDNYSIINIYIDNENYSEQCVSKDVTCDDLGYDDCTKCYYSNGKHCSIYNINICRLSPTCWQYRDSITMRTSSDFQDDNDTY